MKRQGRRGRAPLRGTCDAGEPPASEETVRSFGQPVGLRRRPMESAWAVLAARLEVLARQEVRRLHCRGVASSDIAQSCALLILTRGERTPEALCRADAGGWLRLLVRHLTLRAIETHRRWRLVSCAVGRSRSEQHEPDDSAEPLLARACSPRMPRATGAQARAALGLLAGASLPEIAVAEHVSVLAIQRRLERLATLRRAGARTGVEPVTAPVPSYEGRRARWTRALELRAGGLSVAEIASRLGTTRAAAEQVLRRARHAGGPAGSQGHGVFA